MILDPSSTVQPETTFTLSHKRAICEEATCFDPPGSSNKTLSRSGLIPDYGLSRGSPIC